MWEVLISKHPKDYFALEKLTFLHLASRSIMCLFVNFLNV